MAWVTGLGIMPQVLLNLQVTDCTSDELHGTVLVVSRYEGQSYLVSMLGNDSEWVKNLRAAGGKAFIKRGRLHPVLLIEVPPQKRTPILKAWCQVATSGCQHLPISHQAPISDFEAIASNYPVFRIAPVP